MVCGTLQLLGKGTIADQWNLLTNPLQNSISSLESQLNSYYAHDITFWIYKQVCIEVPNEVSKLSTFLSDLYYACTMRKLWLDLFLFVFSINFKQSQEISFLLLGQLTSLAEQGNYELYVTLACHCYSDRTRSPNPTVTGQISKSTVLWWWRESVILAYQASERITGCCFYTETIH